MGDQVPFSSDICIYGGNSPAAFTAAIQAARERQSVALIAPNGRIGGSVIEGLSSTDVGDGHVNNRRFVGGLALEFFSRVAAAYGHSKEPGSFAWEPRVAQEVILAWLAEYPEITIFAGERLSETPESVSKNDTRIREIITESGQRFTAKVFIDASIEGDLLAFSGVDYTYGREGNATYGETVNGIVHDSNYRQFGIQVDPYVIPGNPSSGVLYTIQQQPLGENGAGDQHSMGYCYRICLTNEPTNRLPVERPEGYDPRHYEIYRRYFAAGGAETFFSPHANIPNNKSDLGSWHDLSANLYGMNAGYPDGTYAERETILTEHRQFTLGLIWFLQNDPEVPQQVKDRWSSWGLPKDEFTENGHWPYEPYIRAARRMRSDYVLTEHMIRPGANPVPDPIAMGYWPLDMHHARRIVKDGHAWNEGFVLDKEVIPFGISYRALTPPAKQCTNLLVPTCPSSSYVGYGALRLTWTFMSLGQGAGAAAALAAQENLSVQDVPYSQLKTQLLENNQILSDPDPRSRDE